MPGWYEVRPGLLDAELQELRDLGADVQDAADALPDQVRWRITLPLAQISLPEEHPFPDPLVLIATFPDHYPYFRPEVETVDLDVLPRHHHPFGNTLCLLGRSTFFWDSDQTLAEHLRTQLPILATQALVTDPNTIRDDPAEQAEPFSDYYVYEAEGVALVPQEAYGSLPAPEGTLHIRVPKDLNHGMRLLVTGAEFGEGPVAFDVPDPLRVMFDRDAAIPFVALNEPLNAATGADAYTLLRETNHRLLSRRPSLKYPGGTLRLAAVRFPEESASGAHSPAWLVIAEWKEKSKARRISGPRYRHFYLRTNRLGVEALFARMSGLAGLRSKVVCVVGLGALGAPLAIELARCGVGELRVLDHDIVETGPMLRWPLGMAAVGRAKVRAVQDFVESNYPYTTVKPCPHRIGGIRGAGPPEDEILADFLSGADLLVDAAAEWGVTHLLGDVAKESELDFVRVFATPGGWGGEVVHVKPDDDACWGCVYAAQKADDLIMPAAAPVELDEVQPPGCADPTFTGASFDLAEVMLSAVRMVVSILTDEEEVGLNLDWQVGIVSLRTEDGKSIPPQWHTQPLKLHEQCGAH